MVQRYVELAASLGRLEGRQISVDASPVAIRGDAVRVEQILNNLIVNAMKFTAPGGKIRIAVTDENGQAVLRVQDDGVGIASDMLPRVFDAFTQGERKLDQGKGGLGIGLTLVRRLAELQGGTVHAHSAGDGEGSEFVVRFPAIDEPSGPAMRRSVPSLDATAQRVLIIEDNADTLESLHAVLAADGHEVHGAADGEAGIEMAERTRPSVVLVDIGLPGIDGYEIARRLRARQAELGVQWRLIALTGYGQPEDVARAKEAGFDTHLVKPVAPMALQAAMA
jgi:CheY-like chemotaxis protein